MMLTALDRTNEIRHKLDTREARIGIIRIGTWACCSLFYSAKNASGLPGLMSISAKWIH